MELPEGRGGQMGRKRKVKDAISLKAQEEAHKKIAGDPDVNVGEHTREYWRKEAAGYHRQLEDIIEKAMLPETYLEEIEKKGREEAEKIYRKKKQGLKK